MAPSAMGAMSSMLSFTKARAPTAIVGPSIADARHRTRYRAETRHDAAEDGPGEHLDQGTRGARDPRAAGRAAARGRGAGEGGARQHLRLGSAPLVGRRIRRDAGAVPDDARARARRAGGGAR